MERALHELDIAAASRLLAARKLSPVELTEAVLARIEACNPTLNAYLTVAGEQARDAAREAEAAIARGAWRGPLHGIPFALKDLYDTRGLPTTAHSALLRDRIPERDAACTERLRAAGGVLLGKLALHEFGTGGPAYDLPWPPARNPWRLDRFPGGSSSGAGAAVAAGLAPAALGTDTGGSIRLPAAYCGVAGLKPTYGRVSKRGVLPLSPTLDTCGPLAWTVEDCAIVLQAIAGHDPADPGSAALPVPDFRAALEAGVKGLRIGVVRAFYEREEPASEATVKAMETAFATYRAMGARLVEVALPPLQDYQACYRGIVLPEAYAIHAEDLRRHPGHYSAVTRYRILPGALLGARDYVDALRFQRVLARRTLEAFAEVDLLLTATTYGPAPVQADLRAGPGFAQPPLSNPFNVAQLPAISVCNGFDAAGLPLAMQVVGRPFDEATVLRAARAYERETPWRDARPRLAPGGARCRPADPRAPLDALAAPGAAAHRARARAAGLVLDARQLADLSEAMVQVDALMARLPRARDYQGAPSTVYRAPAFAARAQPTGDEPA